MTKLEEIIIDMKDNPRPSPDWDVLYEERGEDKWSGLDYTATAHEYEEFQDNIYSWGMGSQEILKDEIGVSAYFGRGEVKIELLYKVQQEISDPNSDGDIEEAMEIRAFGIEFSCGVTCITVRFDLGSIYGEDFESDEHKLNFYCYADGQDWHSHDPATHHHGCWDEMLSDVENG